MGISSSSVDVVENNGNKRTVLFLPVGCLGKQGLADRQRLKLNVAVSGMQGNFNAVVQHPYILFTSFK